MKPLAFLGALAVLSGCGPGDLTGMVPKEIPITESLYSNSRSYCGVEVFRLEPGFVDRLRREGPSVLSSARKPRDWPSWDGANMEFGPWDQGSVYEKYGYMSIQAKTYVGAHDCVERTEYDNILTQASRTKLGLIFSISYQLGRPNNDLLFIDVPSGLLFVAPSY